MQKLGDFKLPQFFNYPPYFTLQPVKDTREKQVQLWKELIVEYCRAQKFFVIGLEDEFPLFTNPVIERSLSHEAKVTFLSALISEGRAEWMDKGHKKCLILWHRIQDWADIILRFVKETGLEDSVMTIDEIRSGIESRGTELHGMDRTVLIRALKILEQKGKAAIFKGSSADDEGHNFVLLVWCSVIFPEFRKINRKILMDKPKRANACIFLGAGRNRVLRPAGHKHFSNLNVAED